MAKLTHRECNELTDDDFSILVTVYERMTAKADTWQLIPTDQYDLIKANYRANEIDYQTMLNNLAQELHI